MAAIGRGRGVLGVIESAYRLDGTEDEWLEGLVDATGRALDARMGAVGYRFRIEPEGVMRLLSELPVATGPVPERFARVVRRAAETIAAAPVETMLAAMADPSVGLATGSQMASRGAVPSYDPDRWAAYAESVRLGVLDHLGVTALDPSGAGVHVCVPRAEIGAVGARESARWRLVVAHVVAGMRLRWHAEHAEAVLDPSGRRLLHAEGPARARTAREALRDAAVAIDRARAGSGDPDAALQRWRALVQGRWSIVDRFESDGRRYLVARKNEPDVRAARGLSRREAQVAAYAALGHTNKSIAYALGLHPSTVSCHLQSAMRRLGARSHAELMEILGAERHESERAS